MVCGLILIVLTLVLIVAAGLMTAIFIFRRPSSVELQQGMAAIGQFAFLATKPPALRREPSGGTNPAL